MCEKHDATMTRLFDEINESKLELREINTKLDAFIEFKDLMHKIVFGNGKEGMVSKVNKVASQIVLQWGLFVVMLVMIVGVFLKK